MKGARPKPRPKYKPRVSMGPLPNFVVVATRWAIVWAFAGVVLGALLMVGKTLSFNGSPAKATSIWDNVFLVPALGLGGAGGGFGIGILFSLLMAVTEDWRASVEETPGIVGRVGAQTACGAVAGIAAGFLAGGLAGALFFGLLGAFSAAALTWWETRSA